MKLQVSAAAPSWQLVGTDFDNGAALSLPAGAELQRKATVRASQATVFDPAAATATGSRSKSPFAPAKATAACTPSAFRPCKSPSPPA